MVLGHTGGGLDTGGSRGYSDRWLGEYVRGLGLCDKMGDREMTYEVRSWLTRRRKCRGK